MPNNCQHPELCLLSETCVPCAICPNAKEKADVRLALTPCSLPPYDEWRKLPPDEAARILAKHRNLDAEQEGLIAAILEHFCPENEKSPSLDATEMKS